MNPSSSPPAHRPQSGPSLSSGAASEALLALGLKPVVRELHNVDRVDEARTRWAAMGYRVATGEPVIEDLDTAAMVVDVKQVHTTRHLATHPVIARAVSLGGRFAERLFLDPSSRVHQYLAERLDAERTPHQGPLPSGERTQERQAIYISKRGELAERARALDRMADAGREEDGAQELGALLGYPSCCVEAFSSLPRRWPNRYPIEAAIARTGVFEPRLNNVALDRFAWIAWFPCRYDCERSLVIAEAAAEALKAQMPEAVKRADEALGRPRLYIDDRHQAELMECSGRPEEIHFEEVRPLSRDTGEDAKSPWDALRRADRLEFKTGTLRFYRDGKPIPFDKAPLFLPFGLR